jgi:hypothetical protein
MQVKPRLARQGSMACDSVAVTLSPFGPERLVRCGKPERILDQICSCLMSTRASLCGDVCISCWRMRDKSTKPDSPGAIPADCRIRRQDLSLACVYNHESSPPSRRTIAAPLGARADLDGTRFQRPASGGRMGHIIVAECVRACRQAIDKEGRGGARISRQASEPHGGAIPASPLAHIGIDFLHSCKSGRGASQLCMGPHQIRWRRRAGQRAKVNLVFQAVEDPGRPDGLPTVRVTGRMVRWVVARRCDWQCS